MNVGLHIPRTFLHEAGPFLERAEVENALMLGIVLSLERGEMRLADDVLLAVVSAAGDTVLAALRTPPHNLLISDGPEEALDALAAKLRELGESLPGVMGPAPPAAHFARGWGTTESAPRQRMRIYECPAVVPPPDPGGALRLALPDDTARIVAWTHAFNEEADNPGTDESVQRMVDGLIANEHMFVWEHEGEVVAIASARQPTRHAIRVSYVYTPPERRRRGYASAVTAGVTQRMLDAGYRHCFLYADLDNPTSNAIYQRIGYTAQSDVSTWHLG